MAQLSWAVCHLFPVFRLSIMATIRKRSGKRATTYQAQVRLAGRPAVTRSFETKEEAKRWARETEGTLQRDRRGSGERRPLSEAIEKYSKTTLTKKAPSTQQSNRYRLEWWHDHYGHIRLDHLTPEILCNARDELEAQASGPTANRYLAVLSHVLTTASNEWGWIWDNPLRRVKRCREHSARVRYLSPEETQELLLACRKSSPILHTVVVVALATGMRRGEIMGLRWKDVDLENRLITLEKTKNRERRGIPVSDALFTELTRLPRHIDTDLLFPSPKKRNQPADMSWRFESAVKAARIEDFRFHDLRHTVASFMAMNRATEREIAEVLGHKTMAMVERYSHLSKSHVRGLLNDVSNALVVGDTEG